MESTARVAWVRDGRAHLACDADETCVSCGTRRGCALRRLVRAGKPGIEVPDRAEGARPLQAGEPVTVEVDDEDLLRAVAFAYLPPLCGVLLVPMLARALAGAGEAGMLLSAIGGATAGWWFARLALLRRPPKVVVRRRSERGVDT